MAKFFGKIGYIETNETRPGVWVEVPTERDYYGDILEDTRRWSSTSEKLNEDLTISNRFSIVADAYAMNNLNAMKFIEYLGIAWKITNVDIQRPRLILSIGGVYNGPRQKT